jgi:hypothetical protein
VLNCPLSIAHQCPETASMSSPIPVSLPLVPSTEVLNLNVVFARSLWNCRCQQLRLHADEVDYGGLATEAVDAQCTRHIVLSMVVIVAGRRRTTMERCRASKMPRTRTNSDALKIGETKTQMNGSVIS